MSRASCTRPLCRDSLNGFPHQLAGIKPVRALHQKLVVFRMPMANVSHDREFHRPFIQGAPSGRTAHPAAAPKARVGSNSAGLIRRTLWVSLENRLGQVRDEFTILLLTPERRGG